MATRTGNPAVPIQTDYPVMPAQAGAGTRSESRRDLVSGNFDIPLQSLSCLARRTSGREGERPGGVA